MLLILRYSCKAGILSMLLLKKIYQKNYMQFLILADDYKDDDALNRRLQIRKIHLQRVGEEKKAGRFIMGGAKLNEQNNMYGSMLILDLENEAAVWKWIYDDPYFTANVWKDIKVFPFKVADV